MNKQQIPTIERRLQRRYVTLVKSHMHTGSRTAAGMSMPHSAKGAFTATQAAWRFFNNDHISLVDLAEPLRNTGREAVQESASPYALLVHDWSKLGYGNHRSKKDIAQLTHTNDTGYELTTALLVSTETGFPLAPMEFHLKAKGRTYSTRAGVKSNNHLNQVLPTMEVSNEWDVPSRLVHVIDREADSIRHMRIWHEAGHLFLVRIDNRKVSWNAEEMWVADILPHLVFTAYQAIRYRAKKARLHVAETTVTLHRPAKGSNGIRVPGKPLTARLVVSRIIGKDNEILAQWFLLTNVFSDDADAHTISQWYYFRWQIESFFKLLKSSGLELEHWQQETALAIARRLLVAAMACVTVWQLERDKSEPAEKMKLILMRFSGRSTKRSRPVTTPGLLHGLFVLLPMLELLEEGSLKSVQSLALKTIPFLNAAYDV
jgi:Transposase DDE domain